jgi:hypothetical protein
VRAAQGQPKRCQAYNQTNEKLSGFPQRFSLSEGMANYSIMFRNYSGYLCELLKNPQISQIATDFFLRKSA